MPDPIDVRVLRLEQSDVPARVEKLRIDVANLHSMVDLLREDIKFLMKGKSGKRDT